MQSSFEIVKIEAKHKTVTFPSYWNLMAPLSFRKRDHQCTERKLVTGNLFFCRPVLDSDGVNITKWQMYIALPRGCKAQSFVLSDNIMHVDI